MSYTIAVAGKGGTGKTTVSALIVRILKEQHKGDILAVDADPNSNLSEALGIPLRDTIGQIIDDIAKHPEKVPSSMSKDRFLEYQIQTAIQEAEGFDVLSMGRPEGPGCYCYVNNVLRNVVGRLMKDYDYIVVDNEAGFEHLSRRTTRAADALVVVSDVTRAGLRSAKRINELIKEIDIKTKNRFLIVNRCNEDIDMQLIKDLELEYIGSIPQDNQIERISFNGNSLMELGSDAIALVALSKLGDKLWAK
jgi:CO dehydrogenase maturation factor